MKRRLPGTLLTFLLLTASVFVLVPWLYTPASGSLGPAIVTTPVPTTLYTTTVTSTTPTTTTSTSTTSTSTSLTTISTSSTSLSITTSYTSSRTITLTNTTTSFVYTATITTGATSISITTTTTSETVTSTSTSVSTTTVVKLPSCLIATATFGSELAPEVQFLRDFRDLQILHTAAGSAFMTAFNAWYYSFSPAVASYESNNVAEQTVMRAVLYPLIGILKLSSFTFTVASAVPEFAALLSGLVASSLIGAFYLGLPLSLIRVRIRRLRGFRVQRSLEKVLAGALLGGVGLLLVGEILSASAVLMVAASTIVLSALFLSAAFTSGVVARKFRPV